MNRYRVIIECGKNYRGHVLAFETEVEAACEKDAKLTAMTRARWYGFTGSVTGAKVIQLQEAA